MVSSSRVRALPATGSDRLRGQSREATTLGWLERGREALRGGRRVAARVLQRSVLGRQRTATAGAGDPLGTRTPLVRPGAGAEGIGLGSRRGGSLVLEAGSSGYVHLRASTCIYVHSTKALQSRPPPPRKAPHLHDGRCEHVPGCPVDSPSPAAPSSSGQCCPCPAS